MSDNLVTAPIPGTESSGGSRRSPDILLAQALERSRAIGRSDPQARAVQSAIQSMTSRFREGITTDGLALAAFYSRRQFFRIFKRMTGLTPGEFLRCLRYAEAMELLSSTNLEVPKIVREVGYRSCENFISEFYRRVGLTPAKYREWARRHGVSSPASQTGTAWEVSAA